MVNAVVKTIVSGLLVFTFCTAGIMKITGKLAPLVHEKMREDFIAFAKVHPLKVWFGYSVDHEVHRLMVGYTEVICGLLLYAGPKPLKIISAIILLVVMAFAMQTLYWLKMPASMFTPAAVCALLLVLMLVFLLKERPAKEKKKE